MTIDLKWLIPFAAPIITILMARIVWLLAGVEWEPTQEAVGSAMVIPFIIAVIICGNMSMEGIYWNVRIWGRRK